MEQAIVFFDDMCILCSRSVQFIYRHDHKKRFYFAALDSEAFRQMEEQRKERAPSGEQAAKEEEAQSREQVPTVEQAAKEEEAQSGEHSHIQERAPAKELDPVSTILPDSVILYMNGKLYLRSTAALHIATRLRFPLPLLAVGYIVPPFIRDRLYDWIARNRYRWFGKRETCFVPEGALRDRVLD